MIRILALIGSHRKQGNTARIVGLIETRLRALAAQHGMQLEFGTLFLGDLDLRPCMGCRRCFDRGEDSCPLADDVPLVRAGLDAADAVVLASPVYVNDVGGLMKTLLDRLAYLSHRPAMGGKYALPLATAGGGSAGHALRTMNAAILTWGYHRAGRIGLRLGALASPDEILGSLSAVDTAATGLFRAVMERKALNPSFLSLMAFGIQQLAWRRWRSESFDRSWWQTRGWLASGCSYYLPHRASPVKVGLARLAARGVARFVL